VKERFEPQSLESFGLVTQESHRLSPCNKSAHNTRKFRNYWNHNHQRPRTGKIEIYELHTTEGPWKSQQDWSRINKSYYGETKANWEQPTRVHRSNYWSEQQPRSSRTANKTQGVNRTQSQRRAGTNHEDSRRKLTQTNRHEWRFTPQQTQPRAGSGAGTVDRIVKRKTNREGNGSQKRRAGNAIRASGR
jgi:hypothetical protein